MMTSTVTGPEMATKTHPWETLFGKGPYIYLGAFESKFQAVAGDPSCPVQPGTSCDYCGQGIMYVCRFRSVKGTEFRVGRDCALRANQGTRLARQITIEQKAHEARLRSAAKSRKAEKVALECAPLAEELEGWKTEAGTFKSDFASSVVRQIRKGKRPSDRQMALINRLRAA